MPRGRRFLVVLAGLAAMGLVSTVVMVVGNFGDPIVEAGQRLSALLGADGSMSLVADECAPLKDVEISVSELPGTSTTDLADARLVWQGTFTAGSLFHTPPGIITATAARLLVIVIGVRGGRSVQYQLVADRSDLARFGVQTGRALRSGEFDRLAASGCVNGGEATTG
jgi:hypothetical protein